MAEFAIGALEVGITSTVQSNGGAGVYAGGIGLYPPSLSFDIITGGGGGTGTGTIYSIVGTVKEKNTPIDTPLRRRVRLYRENDGLLLRETWSNAATGEYRFDDVPLAQRYTVIAYDHLHNYRAVIADNLTPEVVVP